MNAGSVASLDDAADAGMGQTDRLTDLPQRPSGGSGFPHEPISFSGVLTSFLGGAGELAAEFGADGHTSHRNTGTALPSTLLPVTMLPTAQVAPEEFAPHPGAVATRRSTSS